MGRTGILTERVAEVRATVADQVGTGALDAQVADDLYAGLDEVARALAQGRRAEAGGRVSRLRRRLAAIALDGRLDGETYGDLAGALADLAAALDPRPA